MLKMERIKPNMFSYEFEEKLQRATKPTKCQSMLLGRTERNRGSFQLEIFHPLFTHDQNPVQTGSPQNRHSCLLTLRARHCHSIWSFMAQQSHEKQKSVDGFHGEVQELPEQKEGG